MRIVNLDHRLVLLVGEGAVDVATTSSGRFTSDPQAVYRLGRLHRVGRCC